MADAFLYILENATGRFYVGATTDIDRRLTEHNRGKNPSTKHYRPWTVVYTEQFATLAEAKGREAEIKRKKRRSYIVWLKTHGSVV